MQLVRLEQTPFARYLRREIFHRLYLQHAALRRSVNSHLARHADYNRELGTSRFKPSEEIMGTQRLWNHRLRQLVQLELGEHGVVQDDNADRDDTATILGSAMANVLAELRDCRPAPGIWLPVPRQKTCGKYAICPWCRYRLGVDIIERMLPHIPEVSHIATTTIAFPLAYALAHAGDVRYLLHRLDRNRRWPFDVTLTTPHFGLLTNDWNVHVKIVALTNEPGKLTEPAMLVDLQAWTRRGVPPVSGTRWICTKSSPTNLYKAVASAMSYAGNILYAKWTVPHGEQRETQYMDLNTFLELGRLTELFRMKFHGLRSSSRASD